MSLLLVVKDIVQVTVGGAVLLVGICYDGAVIVGQISLVACFNAMVVAYLVLIVELYLCVFVLAAVILELVTLYSGVGLFVDRFLTVCGSALLLP